MVGLVISEGRVSELVPSFWFRPWMKIRTRSC